MVVFRMALGEEEIQINQWFTSKRNVTCVTCMFPDTASYDGDL
jgi:hypothetical protein